MVAMVCREQSVTPDASDREFEPNPWPIAISDAVAPMCAGPGVRTGPRTVTMVRPGTRGAISPAFRSRCGCLKSLLHRILISLSPSSLRRVS